MTRCRGRHAALFVIVLAVSAASLPLQAQDAGPHAREEAMPMPVDAALGLGAVVDAALAEAPGGASLQAHADAAEAYRRRSESWLAGVPAVQLRYLSDALQTRFGVSEAEAGLELPLWRWGQRDAVAGQARAGREGTAEEMRLHRWQLGGLVREGYWNLREAQARLELAQRELEAFERLEQDVRKRIAAGDAAPADRLTSEGQRREREAAVHEAEVVLADRAFAWRVLTGLAVLPGRAEETAAAESAGYVPLEAARAAAARAEAAVAAARAEGAGAPRLLVGARRDTQDGTRSIESLNAQIYVPFGGDSHRQVVLTPLQLEAARLQDEVRRQQQESRLAHHEAEHELHAREVALAGAGARLLLANDEVALARRAYALGETSLSERLLTEIRAADAVRNHQLAVIAHGRAIARYNQVNGVIP